MKNIKMIKTEECKYRLLMIRLLFIYSLFTISCFSQSDPVFSHVAGVYDSPFVLKIIRDDNTIVSYSSSTSNESSIFSDSLRIDSTMTLLFKFSVNGKTDKYAPRSYFINFKTDFSVVSLTIPESHLFDSINGLYVDGVNWRWDSLYNIKKNANYAKKWEREVYVELFNSSGNLTISQYAGIRVYGGLTRFYPEKSLRLIARKKYGKSRFKSDIFSAGLMEYKQLVLRHSGNDYKDTRFKDAISTDLASEVGISVLKFEPSHLFVNSEYWGVYNIREKINKYYIDNNFNTGLEKVNIIRGYNDLDEGSLVSYRRLTSFVKENSFVSDSNFFKLSNLIDVNQFMNYWIYQIYFANVDSRGNVRFWNSDSLDTKFRPILYDVDLGWFKCDSNFLEAFSSPVQTKWYNPVWRTLLFRKVLENETFRNTFINQVSLLLSTHLSSDHIIEKISNFKSRYKAEMLIHYDKRKKFQSYQGSFSRWKRSIEKLNKFATNRDSFFLINLADKFNLINPYLLNIEIYNFNDGQMLINDVKLNKSSLKGVFFDDIPLKKDAIPKDNFTSFSYQFDSISTNDDNIRNEYVYFKSNVISVNSLIINEVDLENQHIEIYNNSDTAVDMFGWELFTQNGVAVIDSIILPKNNFCILHCQKIDDRVDNVIYKELNFSLNMNDKIWLYSSDESLVDTVSFLPNNLFKSYSKRYPFYSIHNEWIYSFYSSIGCHNKIYEESILMNDIIKYERIFILCLFSLLLLFWYYNY